MIQADSVIPLLQVFDMPTSLAFYCGKVGFEIVQKSGEDWCLLRLGGAMLMLNTRYESDERPEMPDPAAVRIHDDTMLFFHCADVEAAYEHLVTQGLEATPPNVTWFGMKQVLLKDPDGFHLCFQREATSTA